MARFAVAPPVSQPDSRTHEGGAGFEKDPRSALFLLGLTNAVGKDTFYESAAGRDKRFADLVHAVTKEDPEWVRQFGGWLRGSGQMRSASVVLAAEYVRAGGPNGRSLVSSVLQRADEPAEMLGYWLNTYGRKIPAAIKRGVADAVTRLYTQRAVLRYDGKDRVIRFGDVLELVHPKPVSSDQSDLFKWLIDRRHGRADARQVSFSQTLSADSTLQQLAPALRRGFLPQAIAAGWSWERLAGWLPGGMDKAAWEAVIPNMGAMALVRNLRNFDNAQLSNEAVAKVCARLMDPEEIRKSRQLPIRFLTAWKATGSMRWGGALEMALEHSLANVPRLKGRTLVCIDVSPSMKDGISSRSVSAYGRPKQGESTRWEVASIFGLAVAKASDAYDVGLFDLDWHPFGFGMSDSILRAIEPIGRQVEAGNGTDTLGSIVAGFRPGVHDRVVIITDEQTGVNGAIGYPGYRSRHYDGYIGEPAVWAVVQERVKVPVITFNVAGYGLGHTPEYRNWHTIGGLSDAAFSTIPLLENHARGIWPWDVPHTEIEGNFVAEEPEDVLA